LRRGPRRLLPARAVHRVGKYALLSPTKTKRPARWVGPLRDLGLQATLTAFATPLRRPARGPERDSIFDCNAGPPFSRLRPTSPDSGGGPARRRRNYPASRKNTARPPRLSGQATDLGHAPRCAEIAGPIRVGTTRTRACRPEAKNRACQGALRSMSRSPDRPARRGTSGCALGVLTSKGRAEHLSGFRPCGAKSSYCCSIAKLDVARRAPRACCWTNSAGWKAERDVLSFSSRCARASAHQTERLRGRARGRRAETQP